MSDAKCYTVNAKLCRLVRANPCIYDRTSTNFSKRECVEQAWASIARELGDSVGSCRERWRNIRTAYARSVNIYKSPCGPNRNKNYYLFNELQFLTKHIAPGLPSLRVRTPTPTEIEEYPENSRNVSIDKPNDDCTFQITIDSSSSPPPVQEQEEQRRESTIQVDDDDVDITRTSVDEPEQLSFDENMNDSVDIIEPQAPKINHDLQFLKNILPEMKIMNARQKVVFKRKIFEALEVVFSVSKDFPQKVEPTMFNISSPISTCAEKSLPKSTAKGCGVSSTKPSHQQKYKTTEEQPSPSVDVPQLIDHQNHETNIKQEVIQMDLED